jgi:hypothetical protein
VVGEERFTVFLISPANLGGQRAKLVFDPKADFEVARRLRSSGGAPLGDVFAFVSGLYFRGKKTYAEAFGRPPPGLTGGLVISPSEGLRRLEEPVTRERLLAWAEVSIDGGNPRFTGPLIEQAAAMERAHGARTHFVLLGSVATDKYVGPLTEVLGERLLFPSDFVGRGDMSRGALLLQAARTGIELTYAPVGTAVRRGPRAPGIRSPRARGNTGY